MPDPGEPAPFSLPLRLSALRDGAVFVTLGGKAVRRPVRAGPAANQGTRIDDGLVGGEDLIVNPPPELKDGDKVAVK